MLFRWVQPGRPVRDPLRRKSSVVPPDYCTHCCEMCGRVGGGSGGAGISWLASLPGAHLHGVTRVFAKPWQAQARASAQQLRIESHPALNAENGHFRGDLHGWEAGRRVFGAPDVLRGSPSRL